MKRKRQANPFVLAAAVIAATQLSATAAAIAADQPDADVPALMRVYMYAAAYGNFGHARASLDAVPAGRGLGSCLSCRECIARCRHTVDIPGTISELKLLYA